MTPFVDFCRDSLHLQFTPYQEAIARVVGGEDSCGPVMREVWGFEGPIERHHRRIIALRLGRRGYKTTLASSFALWRAMTANLDAALGGAPILVPIIAPSEGGTKIALDMCVHLATVGLKDAINTRSHEDSRKRNAITTRSLHLMRPQDGKSVEIRSVVASPMGRNLVGYHIVALILDEAERMRVDSEANITDSEQLDAAMPSMLPGGSSLLISTPYDFSSLMHRHVERNYGHPVDGLAAVATTRQLRPPGSPGADDVLEMLASEYMRRPETARRDYECIPMGREDAYFRAADVDACTIDAPPGHRDDVTGGVDLAFLSDGSGGITVARHAGALWMTWEYLALPQGGRPLMPSMVRQTIGDGLIAAGANVCAADVHEYASLCEDLVPRGIAVTKAPTGGEVATAFGLTRELLRARMLHVLPGTAKQLKSVRTKPSGEPRVDRNRDGHADLVSALVAAVWRDRRHGPLSGGHTERPAAFRGGWTH